MRTVTITIVKIIKPTGGVGMKPLSERDENFHRLSGLQTIHLLGRNEATL